MVGRARFELAVSWSQTRRFSELSYRPILTSPRLALTGVGAAIVLIIAFAVGLAVPRLQLLLPPLIVVVLVTGHAAWHISERAHEPMDRRVAAVLVVGYAALAGLIAFTEYSVWSALQHQPVQHT